MSSESKEKLNEILNKIESLNKAYGLHDSSVFRGVAVRKDEAWYNTVSTLTVVPKSQGKVEPKFEELEPGHIMTFRLWLSAKETKALLKRMEKENRFEVFETQVKMVLDDSNEARWDRGEEIGTRQAIHKYPFEYGVVEYLIDCEYHVSQIEDVRDLIRKHGYHDYHELIADKVFWDSGYLPRNSGFASSSGVHLFIPHHHLSIENVEYDEETIEVTLNGLVPDNALSDFFLTTRVHTAYGEMLSPMKTDPLNDRDIRIPVSGVKYSVEVELWWKKGKSSTEEFVDRFYGERKLGSGNARVISYLQFDSDLKVLEKELNPQKRDSKNFEWGVSMLLHLAGFDTSWLGYPGRLMESEIDVLGFAPDLLTVLAVECTVSSGDIAKKVADLPRKVSELGEVLKDWEIETALFTNLRLEGLAHHTKEAAANQGVLLIPLEGIMRILSLVQKGTPTKLVLEEMKNMYPLQYGW
ncbi:MAG: hypothetical protein KAW09_05545 [Thermoplasmata archaeon]|nr:hypothetical protein [Thermoplasmata archaeon]